MTPRHKLTLGVVALAALHLAVVFAGFFAPYDAAVQDRLSPYLPPMRLHLIDAQGRFHLRPFSYAWQSRPGSFDQYQENLSQPMPLKFFVKGARYTALGFIPADLHLFGADRQGLHLLGTDAFGRDLLSRILFGGQISLLAGLLGAGITLLLGLCIGAAAGYYGG
jgi:peptide/nickel transport system permease protein